LKKRRIRRRRRRRRRREERRRSVCLIPEKNNTRSSFSPNLPLSLSFLVHITAKGKAYYMVITN
jgi:hypothetical protein